MVWVAWRAPFSKGVPGDSSSSMVNRRAATGPKREAGSEQRLPQSPQTNRSGARKSERTAWVGAYHPAVKSYKGTVAPVAPTCGSRRESPLGTYRTGIPSNGFFLFVADVEAAYARALAAALEKGALWHHDPRLQAPRDHHSVCGHECRRRHGDQHLHAHPQSSGLDSVFKTDSQKDAEGQRRSFDPGQLRDAPNPPRFMPGWPSIPASICISRRPVLPGSTRWSASSGI